MRAILHSRGFALLVLPAILVGCADSSGRATGEPGESSETQGVEIRNSPPYPVWEMDSASAVRIGVIHGDDEYQFSNIRYAATLSDGRVVVVDGGSSEVRWYSEDGTFDRRAGRRGGGPGEIQQVRSGTVVAGDTLVLFDSRNHRLTWFDGEGAVVRTRPLVLGPMLGVALQDFGGGSLLMAVESPNQYYGGSEYNHARDSIFAVVISGGTRPDTVLRLLGKEAVTWVDYVDGRPGGSRQLELPFGQGTLVAGLRDAVAVVGTGAGRLDFLDRDGAVVQSALVDVDPQPVSSELRDRYLTSATARAMALGVPAEIARGGVKGRLDLLPEGRSMPVYDAMLVDPVGERVWLRDFVPPWLEDDPQSWTVHDNRGRVLARLTTPSGFDVMHVAQDRITGVSRDRLGVEYVDVYRIKPTGH